MQVTELSTDLSILLNSARISPPNLLARTCCYFRWCKAILILIKFSCLRWKQVLQRVADTNLPATTNSTSAAPAYVVVWRGSPTVRLASWTACADPVHQFIAAKSDLVWLEALLLIELVVPLSQASRLR